MTSTIVWPRIARKSLKSAVRHCFLGFNHRLAESEDFCGEEGEWISALLLCEVQQAVSAEVQGKIPKFCTFGQTMVLSAGAGLWGVSNLKGLQIVCGQTMVEVTPFFVFFFT